MTFDRRQIILAEVKKQFPEYPCFFGFDFIPELKRHIDEAIPFVFVDHAYFERGYEGGGATGNFRVIFSDVHQRGLVDRPAKRPCQPKEWRKGSHILVFPPSETMVKTFDCPQWAEQAVKAIKQHTDRPVYIKPKRARYPLDHYLHDCHAVIGFGTVATVEAAIAGVPVFTGPRCPATPIAERDLSRIESPSYPDRERWLASLTNSQFHLDEIKSGYCREILNGLG